jgi:hypothetical protein
MKSQFRYLTARKEYLRQYWRDEVDKFKSELANSSRKADRALAIDFVSEYNAEYADQLLMHYYNRCMYHHANAFI